MADKTDRKKRIDRRTQRVGLISDEVYEESLKSVRQSMPQPVEQMVAKKIQEQAPDLVGVEMVQDNMVDLIKHVFAENTGNPAYLDKLGDLSKDALRGHVKEKINLTEPRKPREILQAIGKTQADYCVARRISSIGDPKPDRSM